MEHKNIPGALQPSEQPRPQKTHRLQMTDRRVLELGGVEEVSSYDAYSVTLETACGTLVVGGDHIRVKSFSSESGEASIEGEFEYLQYQGGKKADRPESLFKRLMR